MSAETRIRVIAGECTTEFTGTREQRQRGRVVVVVKPDDTVLVHDARGYQPVAWLTRPEHLFVERDPTRLTAADGDQRLVVTVHDEWLRESVPASDAGVPAGDCPTCAGYDDGTLVRARGGVHCTGCGAEYGLPSGSTVLESTCSECGLPEIRARRGSSFELCLDRNCASLTDAVRDAFDRVWDCPDCGADLRILHRGHLLAGCDAYPDCEVAFSLPDGIAVGTCVCGLPTFETGSGERCLDRRCSAGG